MNAVLLRLQADIHTQEHVRARQGWPPNTERHNMKHVFTRPLLLASISSVLLLGAIVLGLASLPFMSTFAAAAVPNPNCTLVVPANPLTSTGLATPYQLKATDPKNGACHEANANQAAFVQGAIIDLAGHMTIYNPLVIDAGTQPAAAPTVPVIQTGSTVALWFGFNGDTLKLTGAVHQGVVSMV
jgi:hypothetical protein